MPDGKCPCCGVTGLSGSSEAFCDTCNTDSGPCCQRIDDWVRTIPKHSLPVTPLSVGGERYTMGTWRKVINDTD